jgi:hypothetical protein
VFAPTCFRVAAGIVCCPAIAALSSQPVLRELLIAASLPARDRTVTPFIEQREFELPADRADIGLRKEHATSAGRLDNRR